MSGIVELALKIMAKGYVCDHCLGRQVAQLLSGMDNRERGRTLRTIVAMGIDANLIKPKHLELENFRNIDFHLNKTVIAGLSKQNPKLRCYLCDDLFTRLDEMAGNIVKRLEPYEYTTFLIGIKLPEYLENRELELWDEIGAIYSESIRNELSRELGKRVQNITGKEVDLRKPDITVVVNLQRNVIELSVASLFIYGRYNKYREMPQSRWLCRHCRGVGCEKCEWKGKMYEESVQERIEGPLLEVTKGVDTSFHGAGREDVDALCTGWREFVIEVHEPRIRSIDPEKLEREINMRNKGVIEVKDLAVVDKSCVRVLKEKRTAKIYEAVVVFDKKPDLKKLNSMIGKEISIQQKTPSRVAHRRAKKVRKRKVKLLEMRTINSKRVLLKIKAEAGTYIKEFVSGDDGRTRPSIAELIGADARVEKLTVIGFEEKW